MKKVSIGCDHGGYDLKTQIISRLQNKYEFIDCGCFSSQSVDYPDFAIKTAQSVANKEAEFGIVICKSGIGVSIAANKVKGVRCALLHDVEDAKLSHMHNNANVIAFGSNYTDIDLACKFIEMYDATEFENRHQIRIDKISAYENKK